MLRILRRLFQWNVHTRRLARGGKRRTPAALPGQGVETLRQLLPLPDVRLRVRRLQLHPQPPGQARVPHGEAGRPAEVPLSALPAELPVQT